MAKDFDLSKYETIETASMVVQNPRGGDLLGEGGLPVTITLYGVGSKQYVAAKHKLDSSNQARSLAMLRNNKPTNADEVFKAEAEFLASVTKSIENFPIAPIELYSNPKLSYIKVQVDEWLGKTENFMPV